MTQNYILVLVYLMQEEEEEDLNYHLLPTRVYKLQTLITAITVGNGFTKRSKFRKF